MGHGVTGFFCLELVNWKPKTCIDHQPSWPFFKQISTSNVPGKTNTNKANLEEAVQVQLWWMTPACLNFLSLLGIYYSIPTFEVFGMCPWSLCYRRSHSVINGCPVFGYVRADVTVISHHCAKLKPRLHLQVVIMVVTNFGQDCGHLEIVSRYRCKTGLNSALVFWHVIHGQMLQELSEKNMVNSWDFQHLRLLLTLPTFNMDIWKSSLWKRTSCSTSSSSLGFHVKLLNLASFFKHKLDHEWV